MVEFEIRVWLAVSTQVQLDLRQAIDYFIQAQPKFALSRDKPSYTTCPEGW